MLQLGELSRKLENLQEQVLPFLPPEISIESQAGGGGGGAGPVAAKGLKGISASFSEGELDGATSKMRKSSSMSLGATSALSYHPPAHQSSVWMGGASPTPVPPPDRLAHFYRKFNKVVMDNISIEKERDRLSAENAQVRGCGEVSM